MKKILFSLSVMIFGSIAMNAQSVSVNTDGSTADASSILDIKSTTKGMLVPRMTTAQRTAIPTPANGLLVYDTDVKSFWYYNGTSWSNITGAGGGGSFILPYDATVNLPGNAFRIANNGTSIEGSSTNGSGVYGYSENGSGINANSATGFGVLATSSQATAIRAFSSNTNPTIHATNTNATGSAISGSSSLHDAILGTSAGTSKAGVYGTSTATNGYGVRGFSTSGTGTYGSSNTGYGMLASSNSGVGLRTSSTSGNALEVFGKLKIYGSAVNPQNGAVLTSDAEGNASWKVNKVAFSTKVQRSVVHETETIMTFDSEQYDYSNSFNYAAGAFTAPVTGVYNLTASVHYLLIDLDDNITDVSLSMEVIRGGAVVSNISKDMLSFKNKYGESRAYATNSSDVKLLAGDVVRLVTIQINDANELILGDFRFCGHLVFAE